MFQVASVVSLAGEINLMRTLFVLSFRAGVWLNAQHLKKAPYLTLSLGLPSVEADRLVF